MKALATILAILLIAVAGTGGYYYNEHRKALATIEELQGSNSELAFEVESLKARIAEVSNQYESKLAEISQEKEAEINRLRETQDKLLEEMKDEIEQKQVEITQLADRLSVSMVDKILFPSGKAEITPEGLKVLERVGNIINKIEDKVIRVEGHTDNVPIHPRLQDEFPSNWELSAARATHVVKFLQEKVGIAPEKLQAVGLSEFHPVASNKTKAGRSKNRRIEIALLPTESALANVKK